MSLKQARAKGRKIKHGAWVDDVTGNFPGVSFRVTGWANSAFIARRNELLKEFTLEERAADGFTDSPAFDKVIDRATLDTILMDWRGLKDDPNGPEEPYSKEAAESIFADEDLFLFREAVRAASQRVADIGRDDYKAEEKN